jgi:hypothetical protein
MHECCLSNEVVRTVTIHWFGREMTGIILLYVVEFEEWENFRQVCLRAVTGQGFESCNGQLEPTLYEAGEVNLHRRFSMEY